MHYRATFGTYPECTMNKLQKGQGANLRYIMEYGSTPYVGMARKKMAAPYNAYKIIRSELGFDYSHRLL